MEEFSMENLFDKIMDNEELTLEEETLIEKLKGEEVYEEEQEIFEMFQEQDDFVLDYDIRYFKNIHEKNKVLAKLKFKELNQ
jgi:hypothetical protein